MKMARLDGDAPMEPMFKLCRTASLPFDDNFTRVFVKRASSSSSIPQFLLKSIFWIIAAQDASASKSASAWISCLPCVFLIGTVPLRFKLPTKASKRTAAIADVVFLLEDDLRRSRTEAADCWLGEEVPFALISYSKQSRKTVRKL